MRLILCGIIILILLSCKTNKDLNTTSTKEVTKLEMDKNDLTFSLYKGGCYGSCPVYHLNIYNNRYVELIGKQNLDKIGTHARHLDKATYKELISAFNEAKFMSLEDNYPSDIPDLPLITISYNSGNHQKTITGKMERPEEIHKLQFRLEQIVQMPGWTFLSEDTSTKKIQVTDKSKFVVNIAKGSQLSTWFSSMKDKFGMQILRKLSDNSDSWLVGINPKLHDPEQVLKYLNADPVVKDASFLVEMKEN